MFKIVTVVCGNHSFYPKQAALTWGIRHLFTSNALQSIPDYYEVLGLSPEATTKDIKQSYIIRQTELQRVRMWEEGILPDKHLLKQAYQVLVDPKKRQKYDQMRLINEGMTLAYFHNEDIVDSVQEVRVDKDHTNDGCLQESGHVEASNKDNRVEVTSCISDVHQHTPNTGNITESLIAPAPTKVMDKISDKKIQIPDEITKKPRSPIDNSTSSEAESNSDDLVKETKALTKKTSDAFLSSDIKSDSAVVHISSSTLTIQKTSLVAKVEDKKHLSITNNNDVGQNTEKHDLDHELTSDAHEKAKVGDLQLRSPAFDEIEFESPAITSTVKGTNSDQISDLSHSKDNSSWSYSQDGRSSLGNREAIPNFSGTRNDSGANVDDINSFFYKTRRMTFVMAFFTVLGYGLFYSAKNYANEQEEQR